MPPVGEALVFAAPREAVRNEAEAEATLEDKLALADEAVRRRRQPGIYRTTWQLTGPQLLDARERNMIVCASMKDGFESTYGVRLGGDHQYIPWL